MISKRVIVYLLLAAFVLGLAVSASADEAFIPGVKIVLEVRTPDGDLRSFQRPGSPPTYWAQDMPVVKGDEVTITPLVATGGAELKSLIIRLNHTEIANKTEAPWRVKVDTKDLVDGYHFIEIWADTKPPKIKENSATTTFLVVPKNDPLLDALNLGSSMIGPPMTDEERLSCAILSRNDEVNKALGEVSMATINSPTLFYASAGPAAKEFFYTLTRDGLITYTSPRLPLPTHIMLQPVNQEGKGEAPGEVILTVRAGDGEGRFGPPAWVTVKIQPEQPAEVAQ